MGYMNQGYNKPNYQNNNYSYNRNDSIKLFLKKKSKTSKKGNDYDIYTGAVDYNKRVIMGSCFGVVDSGDVPIMVVELKNFKPNTRGDKNDPRLKIFLKEKTKKSKEGEEYTIFTGAADMGNGKFCLAKSFGESSSDKGEFIVIELSQFSPNRNIFK